MSRHYRSKQVNVMKHRDKKFRTILKKYTGIGYSIITNLFLRYFISIHAPLSDDPDSSDKRYCIHSMLL